MNFKKPRTKKIRSQAKPYRYVLVESLTSFTVIGAEKVPARLLVNGRRVKRRGLVRIVSGDELTVQLVTKAPR